MKKPIIYAAVAITIIIVVATIIAVSVNSKEPEIKLAIIGGGISGLSLIYFIDQKIKHEKLYHYNSDPTKSDADFPKISIHLFEARDRFGGRMQTVEYGKDVVVNYPNHGPIKFDSDIFRFEAGAEFIDSDHYELLNLIKIFAIETADSLSFNSDPDFVRAEKIVDSWGTVSKANIC